MTYRTISIERRGAVAYVTLTQPERANRVADDTIRDLADACEAIANADDVRAVVLGAEGADFCAGWDAAALTSEGVPYAAAFEPLAALPQPVVAATSGAAVSAGLELALACDIRVAAEDARYAFPEAALGLLPLAGGAARLARAAGRAAALEMLLTGREIDAAEALRLGLVNRVVAKTALAAEAAAIAGRIAERGPIATRFAKEAVIRGGGLTLEQALRYETDLTVLLQTTEDRAEGVRAFVEKRPPRFQGR